VDEVSKVIQTTNAEPTKKVGRTKVAPVMKKGAKAKLQSVKVALSPVQASSPMVTVYRDLNVEAQKLTAEKAGGSKASDDEFSTVPLSPLKTELQNSEISLSLVENFAGEQEKSGGYPCSPLAQSPAGLYPNIPTNIENGGSLFDQENSVMKTENVPQSLRKLRKQVKEKVSKVGKIKASGAAVAAAPVSFICTCTLESSQLTSVFYKLCFNVCCIEELCLLFCAAQGRKSAALKEMSLNVLSGGRIR
jgi:hypothetical protein